MGSCCAGKQRLEEEEELVLLEHQGEHYDILSLLNAVRTKVVVFISPEDAMHPTTQGEGILVDEVSIARADYRVPVVLLSPTADGKPPYSILDGLPRVVRAIREQKEKIPARIITADEMALYRQTALL